MTTLDGLILALVALQVAGTAWIVTRNLPTQLERTVREIAGVALESQAKVKELGEAWTAERANLAAIVEHMEDVAETLQKRRARIVAENRRAEQRDQAGPEDRKMELRRRAGLI